MAHGSRPVPPAACALGLACLLTLPAPAAAAWGARGASCTALVRFHAGLITCYRPNQAALAEQRLPVPPVSPVGPVHQLLQLALRQVLVLHGTPGGRPGPAVALVYVFGTPPPACPRGARCAPYVLVQEAVGMPAVARVQLTYRPGSVPGPWHLVTRVPGRPLVLHLICNCSPRLLRALGLRLRRVAPAAARRPAA